MAARLCKFVETYGLVSGGERAMTSTWYLSPTGALRTDLVALLGPLRDSRWTTQKSLHHTSTSYLGSRVYEVNVNTGITIGSTDAGAPAAPAGTATDGTMPAEVAEVLTLRGTGDTRRSRGRIYLPPVKVGSMSSTGYFTPADRNAMVDLWATYFDGVISGTGDWSPGVYSRVDQAFSTLETIDMGWVFDVQRSRRRSLVENRYSVTIS